MFFSAERAMRINRLGKWLLRLEWHMANDCIPATLGIASNEIQRSVASEGASDE